MIRYQRVVETKSWKNDFPTVEMEPPGACECSIGSGGGFLSPSGILDWFLFWCVIVEMDVNVIGMFGVAGDHSVWSEE